MVKIEEVTSNRQNSLTENDNDDSNGMVIALLDLPKGSRLSLNGKPFVLQRDDFVGFQNVVVPGRSATEKSSFHFVTCQASGSAITIGFLILPSLQNSFVRRYDPRLEEISSTIVDAQTTSNLLQSISNNNNNNNEEELSTITKNNDSSNNDNHNNIMMHPGRVISYSNFITQDEMTQWNKKTNWISHDLLYKRNLTKINGSKIVAGGYDPPKDDGENNDNVMKDDTQNDNINNTSIDGYCAVYPSIPVMNVNGRLSSSHDGFKSFLTTLSPTERTSLFLQQHDSSMGATLLQMTLSRYYNNQYANLLGDIQLSFLLFLYLHCFISLQHWRDCIAMLTRVESNGIQSNQELYSHLLQILSHQVTCIEHDFFQEIDETFLLPDLERLCDTIANSTCTHALKSLAEQFRSGLLNRFHSDTDETMPQMMDSENDDYDEEDEDNPVVLSSEEYQATLDRLAKAKEIKSNHGTKNIANNNMSPQLQSSYPILSAAIMPHEDVLMTCARALDELTDVSLVREAHQYLQQVVQNQGEGESL